MEHIRVLQDVAEAETPDLLAWTNWAREQADKIDPLKNGQLFAHMTEMMGDTAPEFFDREVEDGELED